MTTTLETDYVFPAHRLVALLDHLGIAKAHIATQIPADIAGLATEYAERLGGIVLCTPVRLGPAPLLLPFFLAPSQWAPVIPELARNFTVVTLGGRHLGGIAALEDRARMPTYRAMFRTLIDLIAPRPGEAILDIGCGAGSLDRLLAQRVGPENLAGANPITAIDMNPFWLREAEALAAEEGLVGAIRFLPGNAEAVPFPDCSFDAVFSVTVLEECDADRAIAEMIRVVRPGGRIGIVVRAVDLPQWWNLDLPDAIRSKVTPPPQSA